MSENIERPQLGEWRTLTHFATRKTFIRPNKPTDKKYWDAEKYTDPIQGMYIGYRTLADGEREYIEDAGFVFTPWSYREAWLFVIDPRQKPIYVFPEYALNTPSAVTAIEREVAA
jgi:hypothetical protein